MSRELRRRQAWQAIGFALAISAALIWVPYLDWLGWPLLLGSTLAHELGHGLAAELLGGSFESIELFADGSGVAAYRAHFGAGKVALVAAAGLLGPPFSAWLMLLAGRHSKSSHIALGVLALVLLAVVVLWAGNTLTFVYCAALAAALAAVAFFGSAQLSQIVCVFMAVQLGLASFTRADYLFMESAQTGQGRMLSDVGQIAAVWWLPYWIWGAALAVLSLGFVLLGCRQFLQALR